MRFFPRFTLQIAASCLLAALFIGMSAGPLSAHARLEASSPVSGTALGTMPQSLELRFSEPVDGDSVRIQLMAPDGAAIILTNLTVEDAGTVVRFEAPAPGSTGVFSVAWRVISATDGHESNGTIFFSVGTGRAPLGTSEDVTDRAPWWQIVLRGLWLVSLGAIAAGIPGRLPRGRLIPWLAGVTSIVAAMASPGISFKVADLTTAGLLTLAAGGFGLLAALGAAVSAGRHHLIRIGAAVAWLGGVACLAASGHGAGVANDRVAIAVAAIHTVLTLTWFAAVLRLVLLRAPGTAQPWGSRLTSVATAGLVAIGLTGIATAAIHVPDQRSITSTSYGVSLAIKVALIVLVLAIAATNRWVTTSWLRQHDNVVDRQTRGLWIAEAVALMAVIAVAAVLSNTAPPPAQGVVQVAAPLSGTSQSAQANGLNVTVDAEFSGSPDDVVLITITSPDDTAATGIARLIVETSAMTPGGTLTGDRFDASPLGTDTGRFAFPALRLGAIGIWDLTVTVRRSGIEDAISRFTIDTTGWTVPAPRIETRSWRWPIVPAGAWALLALAIAVAAAGLLAVLRQHRVAPLSGAIIFLALAMISAGFTVQAIQRTATRTSGHDLAAPADADLVSAAADYEALCLACHGAAGGGLDSADPNHQHGSGTNITDERSRGLSDGDLFTLISGGIPGTDMPAYVLALSESERWDLVRYLRSLQSADPATATPEP